MAGTEVLLGPPAVNGLDCSLLPAPSVVGQMSRYTLLCCASRGLRIDPCEAFLNDDPEWRAEAGQSVVVPRGYIGTRDCYPDAKATAWLADHSGGVAVVLVTVGDLVQPCA